MNAKTKNEFLAAYDSYSEAIYRHCFFRVFSPQRAEELVQETYLKTWQYLADGKSVENIRAFLYRVANNLIIDDSRKKKEESLEYTLEKNPSLDPVSDGERDLGREWELKEIMAAMSELPADTKELLTFRFVDDLDPKEIAEILEISSNNVSVKLNRAIKSLREVLNKEDGTK
jgi:RNA polymerase sigma-70 factor (ECF subfamily)